MATAGDSTIHASSTGQANTGAAWLDAHFEANRAEYEMQVRAVGIQPGWRILDAGCGSGSFLPWLADLVGSTGHIAALDLAPDNIAVVEARLADWRLATPVETQVGSVLDLPYPDASFDAVWCANTSQYLTDVELEQALAEMRRVVRPGGLVAMKDTDMEVSRILPAPPALLWHLTEMIARNADAQMHGVLRAPALATWLRKAGFTSIWRRTTLIERTAPVPVISRDQMQSFLGFLVRQAADLNLPADDAAFWAQLSDPANLDRLLDDPDIYLCEGNVLVVGRVPEE